MLINFRNQVYPRLFFIPFFFHQLSISIFHIFFPRKKRRSFINSPVLLISAGIKGWESIEFKELLNSANEYIGSNGKVIQHKVGSPEKYLNELRQEIISNKVSHALYDPRTGRQDTVGGFIEAIKVSWLFERNNVIPIVLLTDLSYRKFRIKASIVTAVSGIVICFVLPRLIKPIFPHKRLFGPFPMPFSLSTLNKIQTILKTDHLEIPKSENKAYFIGSLYEPRTTRLNKIKDGLISKGLDLEIKGRMAGGERRTDEEYWQTLSEPLIVTTADQLFSKDLDWSWVPSLVYRYIEALACGTLLVAPAVPAVSRYFCPSKDFITFDSEEDAIEKIEYFLVNFEERKKIALSGQEKAKQLIESKIFWMQIDTCLSENSLM